MPAALIAPTVPRPHIPQPDLRTYIPSLLACLPGASVSPSPPPALLPLLSPILRQRVQLLSATDNSPWLPLLCYDTAKAGKLEKAVQGDGFELHPVSSEVEIDWADGVKVGYRRRDEETLNAVVDLLDLNVKVILLFCVGDVEGGGDGWRIGEVSVIDGEENSERGYAASILQAEDTFSVRRGSAVSMTGRRSSRIPSIAHLAPPANTNGQVTQGSSWQMVGDVRTKEEEEEEEDDGYWDRYDQTPVRTPAPGASPAPGNQSRVPSVAARAGDGQASVDEDAYYAQYAEVQPAMDGHDPDEAKEQEELSALADEGYGSYGAMPRVDGNKFVEPSIFQHGNGNGASTFTETTSDYIETNRTPSPHSQMQEGDFSSSSPLQQPRPSSSNSSDGSITVERLERTAAAQGQSEIGIKQHVSTSVKSLYRLARAAGIDRVEFERLVRTELDVLSLMELEDAC